MPTRKWLDFEVACFFGEAVAADTARPAAARTRTAIAARRLDTE
jgi:hypothetical protein